MGTHFNSSGEGYLHECTEPFLVEATQLNSQERDWEMTPENSGFLGDQNHFLSQLVKAGFVELKLWSLEVWVG